MKCTLNGEDFYCSTTYLWSIDDLVLGTMPEAEYMSIVSGTKHDTIFGFVFCILVLTVVTFLFAKRFVCVLNKM